MAFNREEVLKRLKFEITMLEKGGYYPSVRDPHHPPEVFRDSITCLNIGFDEKKYPCVECVLAAFIPPERRDDSGNLCHKIPLNERGDTIESLEAEGDAEKLHATVLAWLKKTVGQLENDPSFKPWP